MDGTELKLSPPDQPTLEAVASIYRALAASSRLKILLRLRQQTATVGGLANWLAMEPSAVSQQLRVLRHLRLVTRDRCGRTTYYRIYDRSVARLVDHAVHHVEHVISAPDRGGSRHRLIVQDEVSAPS
ncbi:ArsR/SmtB family transcription factor [Actinomycetospora flava]|uniref:Metalloregulator ArsR/SmtB family transcription factor n=1 Tax=Actinomycetospora flava TaxID=3129232 RepID=A0ABU8MBA4_9PSEU